MASPLARGLISAAAGTVALDITTYLDMVVRARPPSSVPARDVAALARRLGISLGDDAAAEARKQGAGALLGYLTGLGGGVAYAIVEPLARRLPRPLAAVSLGLGVMAATDATSAALGTTDPREWSAVDWAADVIPHLVYGAATVAAHDVIAG